MAAIAVFRCIRFVITLIGRDAAVRLTAAIALTAAVLASGPALANCSYDLNGVGYGDNCPYRGPGSTNDNAAIQAEIARQQAAEQAQKEAAEREAQDRERAAEEQHRADEAARQAAFVQDRDSTELKGGTGSTGGGGLKGNTAAGYGLKGGDADSSSNGETTTGTFHEKVAKVHFETVHHARPGPAGTAGDQARSAAASKDLTLNYDIGGAPIPGPTSAQISTKAMRAIAQTPAQRAMLNNDADMKKYRATQTEAEADRAKHQAAADALQQKYSQATVPAVKASLSTQLAAEKQLVANAQSTANAANANADKRAKDLLEGSAILLPRRKSAAPPPPTTGAAGTQN